MKKELIKVKYDDKFDMTNDKRFSYCMVDKDIYKQMKEYNLHRNICIYFFDNNNNEYGMTIDNIDTVTEI